MTTFSKAHRATAALALLALLGAACTGSSTPMTTEPASTSTTATVVAPTTTTTMPNEPEIGLVAPVVRSAVTDQVFYMVMTDRFANGDESNDFGSDPGGTAPAAVLRHGFDPTDFGYFHGGDIAGLRSKLDYIAGLGITSIWITPPFTNKAVQGNGTIRGSSAGYHGYWQVDYTTIDPHLGSNEEMRAFVDAAHQLGLKVYFDAVPNHTADVITYAEGVFGYRGKSGVPYTDTAGNPFDDHDFATGGVFPDLDAETSFPYTPVFVTPAEANAKSPDWLNNPIYYHNRGNSTFTGESSLYGDFFGLDDLFTEHPDVISGMIEIHTAMIDEFDIDGFRVDTTKHVNDEFWEAFVPAIVEHAAARGKPDFFLFGEVFGESPAFRSSYTTRLPFQAVLDFGFSDAAIAFASGVAGGKVLADHFDDDDWYTDADSNASMLVKFMGNHDIGRIGGFATAGPADIGDERALGRVRTAFEVMYLTRGTPLVYYGDEQGFVGDGGDKAARQDMFPSRVDSYNDDDLIGTDATTADDNFDTASPLYQVLARLAALRGEHDALVSGPQVSLHAEGGVFVFSRLDRSTGVEYLVMVNGSLGAQGVAINALTPEASLGEIYPATATTVETSRTGFFTLRVPALTTLVLRADRPVPVADVAPVISISRPAERAEIRLTRFRIQAEAENDAVAEVTFAVSVDGAEFTVLGTDDAPPYRVYWDSAGIPNGTTVQIMATLADRAGNRSMDVNTFTLAGR